MLLSCFLNMNELSCASHLVLFLGQTRTQSTVPVPRRSFSFFYTHIPDGKHFWSQGGNKLSGRGLSHVYENMHIRISLPRKLQKTRQGREALWKLKIGNERNTEEKRSFPIVAVTEVGLPLISTPSLLDNFRRLWYRGHESDRQA